MRNRVFLAAAAVLASASWAAAAPAPATGFHPGKAAGVAGYLLLKKAPFLTGQLEEADVRRAQACKDETVRKEPALDAPGEAKQASARINQCLGPESAVFTLPWQGSTPINTYFN